MKDSIYVLPPTLRRYVRNVYWLFGIWAFVCFFMAALLKYNADFPPVPETSHYQVTETVSEPVPSANVEITPQDEVGKYRITENGTDVGRLKLEGDSTPSVLKLYSPSGELLVKAKLKSDSVNFYAGDGKRAAKLKYKKGSYRLRRDTAIDLREDLSGEMIGFGSGLYLYLPLSADIRRKLQSESANLKAAPKTEADANDD